MKSLERQREERWERTYARRGFTEKTAIETEQRKREVEKVTIGKRQSRGRKAFRGIDYGKTHKETDTSYLKA